MDNKKTVLVDMTRYNDLSGFGEIDRNFGPKLKNPPDIRFVFLVWAKDKGVLGQDKHYVTMENLKRDIKALGFGIDLWHSTDQIFFTRKRMKPTKYLLTVHDLNFLYEKRGIHRLKHLLRMKWRVAHSDYIAVISQYVKHDLLSHIDVGNRPVEVVYNGIRDMTNAPQAKPKFIEDEGERFFFTIGQIREKKNFHLLIPMMRHFPSTKLYICGLMNKHFKDRFMEIYEAENPGNVVLTGGISDAERT